MAIQFFNHAVGPVSPARPILPTVWPHFDLLWVHAGRIRLTLMKGEVQLLQSGTGVLIHPHTPFRGDHVSGACRVSVQHFLMTSQRQTPQLLAGLRARQCGYDLHATTQPEMIDAMIARALELAGLQQSTLIHEMRVAQLVLILGELQLQKDKTQVRHEDRLQKLVDEIQRDPSQHRTLDEMAGITGLSTSHFRALFRQRTGETPGQFQLRAQMREAARLLRSTDLPIKQIALQLRFDQLPHFYRRFVASHGTTPASYRKTHAKWA